MSKRKKYRKRDVKEKSKVEKDQAAQRKKEKEGGWKCIRSEDPIIKKRWRSMGIEDKEKKTNGWSPVYR